MSKFGADEASASAACADGWQAGHQRRSQRPCAVRCDEFSASHATLRYVSRVPAVFDGMQPNAEGTKSVRPAYDRSMHLESSQAKQKS
jgi:hypothetical protein